MAKKQATEQEAPVFNTELLLGSMRDHLLDVMKKHLNWPKMPEKKQASVANEVEQACRQAIRGATPIIAGRGFGTIDIKLSGMKRDKDGFVEAKFLCSGTDENVVAVWRGGHCLIVLADAGQFMNALPAEIMKDQPDLMDKKAEKAETAEQREERERAESLARAEQFKQAEPVEALEDVLAKTAEGTATPAEGEPVEQDDGTVIDNETGEVLVAGRQIRSPRGHRGRKALPAPAEA